jgi:hypothetical protein
VLEHAVEVLIELRGIQRRAHEARALPSPRTAGMGQRLDSNDRREARDDGGNRGTPDEASAWLLCAGSLVGRVKAVYPAGKVL